MISRFFIDRPIFATVISVVITLAGFVAMWTLPVAQYPEVTPPTVLVTALYPGANAKTVRDTVAAPIEEQVSGVEGMMYMSSRCTNDGAYNLTVTFKLGTDSDMAQVLVQNRVSLALPVIPALVQNEGISVKKMSPNTMMIVNLISPDGRYDSTFLSNYATIYVKDELGRLQGVAGITYLGPARLQPARLARSRQAGGPDPERHGRGHRHRPAKRAGGGGANRPATGAQGAAVSAHDQHPGPAHRSGGVRRHHHQGRPDSARRRSRRRAAPAARRRRPARPPRPPASSICATWCARTSTSSASSSIPRKLAGASFGPGEVVCRPQRARISRSRPIPTPSRPTATPLTWLADLRRRARAARARIGRHQDRHPRNAPAAPPGRSGRGGARHRASRNTRRGRRPARLAAVRSVLHARRQAFGGPVDLSASRLQRPGNRARASTPR